MGNSGLQLSEISLGSWFFGEQVNESEVYTLLHFAYENGINFFDTADKYGGKGEAERLIGKGIKDLPREALVIATKVFSPMDPGPNGRGLSRKHIMEACNASLRRLDIDYIDIYFCHSFDKDVTHYEIVRAMDDLIHQGKVLYWGTSNWLSKEIRQAHELASKNGFYLPCVEQAEYSMLVREKVEGELENVIKELGIGLVTYGPLNSGLLTGKYNNGIPKGTRYEFREWLQPVLTDEKKLQKVRLLSEIADRVKLPLPEIAIAWLLRIPWITSVITGASKTRQIKENISALDVYKEFNDELLLELDQILG
jgi:voltage-dependent potassium channel beta subunit